MAGIAPARLSARGDYALTDTQSRSLYGTASHPRRCGRDAREPGGATHSDPLAGARGTGVVVLAFVVLGVVLRAVLGWVL
jgi:hypothetical protein